MTGLAVVGSINLDLVVGVAALPRRGETVVGHRAVALPGGKGANQAAAAAMLSAAVAMVGRVGDDPAAAGLLDDLRRRGVDVSAVRVGTELTGTATVVVEDGTGENLIVVSPGANGAVAPSDVEVDVVRDAAVVLVQLEIPLDAVAAAVAHARGLVVLNPAPATALPADLLQRVDVLVPNRAELARLAGADLAADASVDDVEALARSVTDRDVVVTLGARGAVVVPARGGVETVAAPPLTTVDTTGAGDCFCAALGVALAAGVPLVGAARYATVAASLSTRGTGARGALPTDAEVRALLA